MRPTSRCKERLSFTKHRKMVSPDRRRRRNLAEKSSPRQNFAASGGRAALQGVAGNLDLVRLRALPVPLRPRKPRARNLAYPRTILRTQSVASRWRGEHKTHKVCRIKRMARPRGPTNRTLVHALIEDTHRQFCLQGICHEGPLEEDRINVTQGSLPCTHSRGCQCQECC